MKKEHPLQALASYMPKGAFDLVVPYITFYKVELTLTRERQSVLGDYRHPYQGKGHRISINSTLNKYAFLITLLHELAHLTTYIQFGNRVAAHGKEWKMEFSKILKEFVGQNLFPPDVELAVRTSLQNPAASSCADEQLMRVLKQYDEQKENHYLVEQLPPGTLFKTKDGRVFRKGERIRKRFRCEEVTTKRIYLFSPVYEVEMLTA
ncbi:SprT-like family protein [Chitinophaga skermanii]|uniref:SprT-like family protein n=1 Tax=Chitinophaga skermanii TaxID=331697 RepID=A0A327Q4K1_9BACT|nr:SprT-like domain-containing protein [Chitinophaga skermanii]RAI99435.1 SprT-like family protein [Chitinophaga skermanii]